MCEFCTTHGDGQVWFKDAANYGNDLIADIKRRHYVQNFFQSTIEEGIVTIGRLETLYSKKRSLPHRLTQQLIDRAKQEHFGQVVTIEDIRQIVGKAASVVRLPCACRWAAMKKEARCCYSVSYTPQAWYQDLDMGYFGHTQDMGLESISPDKAISQMEKLEDVGAVHTIWTMITPFIGAICNCQPQECLGLRTLSIDVETMFRGESVALVDKNLCTGCGACSEACQFKAIRSTELSGEQKAYIDTNACFGCGLCRRVCPVDALSMTPR